MKSTPSIEVDLKGQEGTSQIFLAPIENFPYIKQKDIYQSLEYYLCTAVSVFLLSFFTTSAGFKSYNYIIKHNLELSLSYLTKYRDYEDLQWKYFRTNFFIFLFIGIAFVAVSKFIKKYNSGEFLKYFYTISGIFFALCLIKFRILYIFSALFLFYFTKKLIVLGDRIFVIINWCELFLCKFIIAKGEKIFELKKILQNENNDMDNITWEFILVYSLLKMLSYNIEYKKIYFEQTVPESIFSLNQARSHCMECYDGNFCAKCLENTVISDKDKTEDSFDIINLINYIFYLPLLYNGPLINYNSFIFQLNIIKDSKHNDLIKMNKILYFLKFLLIFTIMEVYNHFLFPIFLFRNGYTTLEPNNS